jgi:3-oxoacyl-[acyl-carrier protein] reductase
MHTGLDGSRVLVTGASGGIGLAAARAFSEEGAAVALQYRTQPEPVRRLVSQLPGPSAVVHADLRLEDQVEAMFAAAVAALGGIDCLVVNAGIWAEGDVPVHRMTLTQWNGTLEADLTTAFLTCRGFLRHLADVPRQAASIVLVGSTAALFGEAGHADYAAAKAGMVHGLTLSLKNEIVALAPRGRVNAVCPGWTATPMAARFTSDAAAVQRATATMSLRKVAQPEDVAAAILFLSSDRLAGHLSGTVMPVAGGMEGRLLHEPHEDG